MYLCTATSNNNQAEFVAQTLEKKTKSILAKKQLISSSLKLTIAEKGTMKSTLTVGRMETLNMFSTLTPICRIRGQEIKQKTAHPPT